MGIGDRWLIGLPAGHFDHASALTLLIRPAKSFMRRI
jgi:hypothetical protein